MSLKIKKGIPLIDQHDKNGMWGGKFGGNFVPETLKKPIDDLTKLFEGIHATLPQKELFSSVHLHDL